MTHSKIIFEKSLTIKIVLTYSSYLIEASIRSSLFNTNINLPRLESNVYRYVSWTFCQNRYSWHWLRATCIACFPCPIYTHKGLWMNNWWTTLVDLMDPFFTCRYQLQERGYVIDRLFYQFCTCWKITW